MAFGGRGKAAEQAVEAMTAAKANQQELAWLKKQVQKQRLISEALWSILKEKLSLADQDLSETVKKIEESQRNQPKVAELCTKCGRALQENRTACIYCGHEVAQRELF